MNRFLLPLLFLLGAPAAAQSPEGSNVLSDVFKDEHDCDARMSALDAAVKAHPDWVKPRLDRAECYYRVGRYQWVTDDLTAALKGRTLAQAIEAAKAGGVSEADARASVENASVVQVRMHLHNGAGGSNSIPAAQGTYTEARALFGDSPAMARAEISILGASGRKAEAWRAVEAALARWPGNSHAKQAANEMATLDPDNVPPRVAELLNAPALTISRYNDATTAFNTGRYDECLSIINESIPSAAPDQAPMFQRLAYGCAVSKGDLKQSNDYLVAMGGLSEVQPVTILRHSDMLYREGRYEAALELLKAVDPTTPQLRDQVATLRVRIYTKQGALDDAVTVAKAGQPDPGSAANLALALQKAGRHSDALAVLTPACPRMTGEDAAKCYDFLKQLARQKKD